MLDILSLAVVLVSLLWIRSWLCAGRVEQIKQDTKKILDFCRNT